MEPIIGSLSGIAAKPELRPKSAYMRFVAEKMQLGKTSKAGGCKTIKEAAGLWKTMEAKQKEPYLKMAKADKAKADSAKKEFGDAFDTHWDAIEKIFDEEAGHKKEKIRKHAAEKKANAVKVKTEKATRKKQLMAERKRRAATMRGAPAVARTPARAAKPVGNSADHIAKLKRGLDTSVWEVVESRSKPGFFYYRNLITNQSVGERPTTGVKRAR